MVRWLYVHRTLQLYDSVRYLPLCLTWIRLPFQFRTAPVLTYLYPVLPVTAFEPRRCPATTPTIGTWFAHTEQHQLLFNG